MSAIVSVSSLRLTYFQADKLRHAGGNSRSQSSPYRITTYKGPELGLVGALPTVLNRLHDVDALDAANQSARQPSDTSLLQKIKLHYLGGLPA